MSKVFIVAEIGANHRQSYDEAERLVHIAKDCGADAVKFQTYTPAEIAVDVPIVGGPWDGRSYHELYEEGSMPWEWHRPLFMLAREIGIVPFSSPFSVEAVHRLESIDCPIYKIASPEIGHHQLIAAAAATGKPLIISTGMATPPEIYDAAQTAWKNGCDDLTMLHCLSAYPAETENFNMETMRRLEHRGFTVGLSDHSVDNTAVIMAVTMGATVIEKHLTRNAFNGSLDSGFSLEPYEFSQMVRAVRLAEAAMGDVVFGPRPGEETSLQYRRSIWIVKAARAGEEITAEHLAVLRPATGVKPYNWDKLIGKRFTKDVLPCTPVSWDLVE
jgi:N-acetylneuraminate synthase